MTEAFSWPQGTVWFYTGTATASASIAFARNSNLSLTRGWDSRPTLSGLYRDHLTGQRADVTMQVVMNNDFTLPRLFESATAIHAHFRHYNSGLSASGGFYLYSGRMDGLQYQGQEANAYVFNLTMHFHNWSAYGGFS